MRRLLILTGFVLIVCAILLGLGFDRFVDQAVRPWVMARGAAALSGEVRLDRLQLDWGEATLDGLEVARPGAFRLKVARVVVRFTFAGLWRRQLDTVTIRQPEVDWESGSSGGSPPGRSPDEPPRWPRQPPLRVGNWTVEDGRLQLALGKDRLLLQQLEVAGGLDDRFTLKASARLGAGPGVPLELAGQGRWEGQPELTITSLLWSGHPLLQTPVTIAPGAKSFAVALTLAQLDDREAGRLLAAIDRPPPWPPQLVWRITHPRLTAGMEGDRLALRLETGDGEVRQGAQRWPWESLQLQVAGAAGTWQVDGEIALPAQARLQLAGRWSDERFRGRWRLAAPAPAATGAAAGFELPAAERLRELEIAGDLQATAGAVAVDGVRLTARLQGGGRLAGALAGRWQEDSFNVEASDFGVWLENDRLATASLQLAGSTAAWRGGWRLQATDLLRLSQALTVTTPAGLPNVQELELQGEMAAADGSLSVPVRMSGRLLGSGLSGRLSGALAARRLAAGWRVEVARLAATELEYLAPDGLTGIASGSLQLSGSLDLQQKLAFALQGEAAAGEALAGSWYADLAGLPLRLTLAGAWTPAAGVRLDAGHLDLAGLAAARLQGSLAGNRLAVSGEITVPRLDGPFQERLRQLAGGVVPALEQLEMAGGLTVTGAGEWRADGWALEAAVRPTGVMLARGDTFRLTGLSGELPLLLQRGAATPATGHLATLRWDELRAGPLTSGNGRLRLAAAPNRWQLDEPLRLAAGGGWLELTGLILALPPAGPELRAALKATTIDMAELSRTLGWPELGGRLEAELPDIRFAGEELTTGGEALLQLFDGTVRIRNMRLNKPFSRYPTYHADIDFAGIDLRLLTQAFAFGEVNGIADGFVHDLRLFGTVPSAFRARFETRPEGTRNISVKALRNLNTLSQGGISAALSQGIYRFIDFYRYEKIGIRCGLQNDVLHLEGSARHGTTTHLIDSGWLPPRIEIIVTSPTISFQEMVKRLKRIERAGH